MVDYELELQVILAKKNVASIETSLLDFQKSQIECYQKLAGVEERIKELEEKLIDAKKKLKETEKK
jgi:hypothetical protein